MEKPRSGIDSPRPLIIERPDLQSRPQRLVSTTLTAVFWAVWLYLWLPAVALLGWWLGISRFYEEMVRLQGYQAVVELLGWYAICVAVLAGSLIAWAVYNLLRFRGPDRRKAGPALRVGQVAEALGVEPDSLLAWQRARILHVTHDEAGRIDTVRTLAVPGAEPGDRGSEDAGPETLLRSPVPA